MRGFIFSVWTNAGKTASATVTALETLAANQYTVAENGGRQMISASVQGKSFSYSVPDGMDASYFSQLAFEAWQAICTGGASGGTMTDAELLAYLKDTTAETSVTRARFMPNKVGQRHGY